MVPGQHLVEADLTHRFGVSRGSLREGLKRLAADGVVELTRYRGAYIAALDRKAVHDLLAVLEPLCLLAAHLAAANCNLPADRQSLTVIARDLERFASGSGRSQYLENRRLFYDTLIRIGGNTELGRVIPLARTDLFRAQFYVEQTKAQQRHHAAGYVAIAEAVAANDVVRAGRAVRRHFAGTRKSVDSLPDQTFARLAPQGS